MINVLELRNSELIDYGDIFCLQSSPGNRAPIYGVWFWTSIR